MDLKKYLEKNTEKDIISKIYHNDMEELQSISQSKEYIEISKKIESIEKDLLKKFSKEKIGRYREYINERDSMDAESQFKLGFKTAIKIILQALK